MEEILKLMHARLILIYINFVNNIAQMGLLGAPNANIPMIQIIIQMNLNFRWIMELYY